MPVEAIVTVDRHHVCFGSSLCENALE